MFRIVTLLSVHALICLSFGCSAEVKDLPAVPTAAPELPAPAAPETPPAAATAPIAASADGYYTATFDVGNNNSHQIGLTITGETAELVNQTEGQAFNGYTTLAVKRDGPDAVLTFVSNSDSNGVSHQPVAVGAEVLRIRFEAGKAPVTTWGAFKPAHPVVNDFQPAEPEVFSP